MVTHDPNGRRLCGVRRANGRPCAQSLRDGEARCKFHTGPSSKAPGLTIQAVSAINRARCERWHPGFPSDGWTGADWATAMAGEAGETCNVVKKLRRDDFGKVQAAADSRAELLTSLATEIGDTFLYLDLLAQFYGLDLAQCVVDTFNRVSAREGFPERIERAADTTVGAGA